MLLYLHNIYLSQSNLGDLSIFDIFLELFGLRHEVIELALCRIQP